MTGANLKTAETRTPGGSGGPPAIPPRLRRRLLAITAVLALLTVVHDLDHVRQGRAVPSVLYAVGVVALVMTGATLALLMRRHALARAAALFLGIATTAGLAAVHAAPQWAWFTDSYSAAHADALSWSIIVAMMLAGLALAVAAIGRRRG